MPSHGSLRSTSFGQSMRDNHFAFDPDYIPLNHGSYGAYPIAIRDHQRALQDRIEARSDPRIRFTIPDLLYKSRVAAAKLLGAPTDDLVFVPNATTAVNTVFRNLRFIEGDVILYFCTAYGACEKTIQYVCETTAAEWKCIDVTFPIDDTLLIQLLRDTIQNVQQQGRKARIAMFDTVVTFPGVRVPWEGLVRACRDLNVLSLIDGAHGIGHIDLTHLARVEPDFFTSNCYKWLYTPRACAIFYVPFRNQHLIRSTIPTSHGFEARSEEYIDGSSGSTQDPGRFGDLFKWVATVDQTPYLCVPEAIKFRTEVCGGEDKIREYCFNLARDGGHLLAKVLSTQVMQNTQDTLGQCCFTNVRLPLLFDTGRQGGLTGAEAPNVVKWIMDRAMCEFNTWIPGKFYAGAIWVRLSAQIYLDIKDFEWAAGVLKQLCDRVTQGEWHSSSHLFRMYYILLGGEILASARAEVACRKSLVSDVAGDEGLSLDPYYQRLDANRSLEVVKSI